MKEKNDGIEEMLMLFNWLEEFFLDGIVLTLNQVISGAEFYFISGIFTDGIHLVLHQW